jgi:hypothetical protein
MLRPSALEQRPSANGSIVPKVFKSRRAQLGVTHGVLNITMPQIVLQLRHVGRDSPRLFPKFTIYLLCDRVSYTSVQDYERIPFGPVAMG